MSGEAATQVFAIPELYIKIVYTHAGCRTDSATAMVTMTAAERRRLLPSTVAGSLEHALRAMTRECDDAHLADRVSQWLVWEPAGGVSLSLARVVAHAVPLHYDGYHGWSVNRGSGRTTRKLDIQRTLTVLEIPWKKRWTKAQLIRAYLASPDPE